MICTEKKHRATGQLKNQTIDLERKKSGARKGRNRGEPLDELMADLEPDRLDPARGKLRFGGVEPPAVGRDHLDEDTVDATLRHLPSHLCLSSVLSLSTTPSAGTHSRLILLL